MTNPNHVLIIDDEEEIGRFIANVAEMVGYEAVATTDIVAFRERVSNWSPSHIFLDLSMPNVDGIEILRYLAGERSQAKIVIISGFDLKVIDSARQIGIERGLTIAGTLTKPIQLQTLREVLETTREEDDWLTAEAVLDAIARRELFLVFQPKVRLAPSPGGATRRGEVAGFEALVRWAHPRRGLVPPMDFIPFAESAGLMTDLTRAIIDLALEQMAIWSRDGRDHAVSINVSAADLSDVSFTDRISERCREAGVSPQQIVLELTETAAMENVTHAMDILTRLRIRGFKISMDDFGTGYSSLVQLQRLPFSELKIDQTFVKQCHQSEQSRVIVKTMVDLAHNLGLVAVAEGVENEQILAVLAEIGCDAAQGYHISPPLVATDVEKWLAA